VGVNQAIRNYRIQELAITKLDVLSGFEVLRICTRYTLDGRAIDFVPANAAQADRCQPVFEQSMEGFTEDISGLRQIDELPRAAQTYLKTIEQLTGRPIKIIGVGKDREQTIVA
jgi:adenylosuccinate synthase